MPSPTARLNTSPLSRDLTPSEIASLQQDKEKASLEGDQELSVLRSRNQTSKPSDFSTLPEHMRERERLNEQLHQQMQAECHTKGIKTSVSCVAEAQDRQ